MSNPSDSSSNQTTSAEGGMITTAFGGITKAIGAFGEGQSQQQMFDYEAGVARLNAQIAYQNAEYAVQTGEHQAMQAGLQGAATSGRIKAAQGATGLDVNTGSTVDVQKSQALINSMNQTTIRSNAAKTAYNYEVQGMGYGAQAQLDTVAGKNAAISGDIGAISSVIGAASSVSSQWQRGAQVGLFGPNPSSGNTDQAFGN